MMDGPLIRVRIASFCCKCEWIRPRIVYEDGPPPHNCEGCGHEYCGRCGETTSFHKDDIVLFGGYPEDSKNKPIAIRMSNVKLQIQKLRLH